MNTGTRKTRETLEVDGVIHCTAGPLLRTECAELRGWETGEAKITGVYGLPAKYVIHRVGPIVKWRRGEELPQGLLPSQPGEGHRHQAMHCGYPPEQPVHVALETVRKYLDEHREKLDSDLQCVPAH
uniref:Macro domain-containing protein n=1 Tax=Hucho hucho TaxID=62062 RepID=A0A4W5NK76_9TELE